MTFNVNEVLGSLNAQNGLLVPTDYQVAITMGTIDTTAQSWTQIGTAADQQVGQTGQAIAPFLCDAANLPGVSFDTSQIFHSGYGFSENRPVKGSYQNFILSFIVASSKLATYCQSLFSLKYGGITVPSPKPVSPTLVLKTIARFPLLLINASSVVVLPLNWVIPVAIRWERFMLTS